MDDARIGPGGRPDDETRPLDLAPLRPVGSDPEPVVAAASFMPCSGESTMLVDVAPLGSCSLSAVAFNSCEPM